jgi:putative addiction module component (TIGR02574 family)
MNTDAQLFCGIDPPGAATMSDRAKALGEQARELSPPDRIALVEDVLDSLDSADPRVDRLWAAEAKDRLAAYRRGELAAKDLNEIVAKYRS